MNVFMQLPPGPRSPSFVQLLDYVYRPVALLENAKRDFGDVFTLRLGRLGNLVVLHRADHVEAALSASSNELSAALSNEIARPVVGSHSVFSLDGQEHLARRKLLLQEFQSSTVRRHMDTIRLVVQKRLAGYQPGQRLVLHREFNELALEIIFRVVFGVSDAKELGALNGAFRDLFQEMPAILSFLPALQATFVGSPFWFWLKKRHKVARYLLTLIDARRKSQAEHTDVLTALLTAQDDEGRPLSEEDLVDELITAVVAGHETVATQLAWAFDLLLREKETLETLTQEVLVTPDEDLRSAPFLDACLNEVLRLRPVFPLIARGVRTPTQVAGIQLPAGAVVAPSLWLAHHDARNYPNPEAFSPARWAHTKRHPHMFLPFGGGIRRCAGMAFAELELKMVLAHYLRRWVYMLESPAPARIVRRNITLFPEGGAAVTVLSERRS